MSTLLASIGALREAAWGAYTSTPLESFLDVWDAAAHHPRASKACQYAFTGVDIIIDRKGEVFILEVNPPSNFVALDHDLGIPMGDMIVDYLIQKSQEGESR